MTDGESRILWTVDANSFASLAILNRNWYQVAQNRELYAHHLSRCPSYALSNTVITGPFRKFDLYRLKTKFAAEVRRNLFGAYLRPRQTLINLISVNASSSAALPGAEAFRFSFSPNGRTILALSSSRIYVIDATTDPITVRNELKTLRRPLAASITDDGATLAVLSSKHQANVYQLSPEGVKHVQVLVMDNPPRTVALAPEGTVLAAAYDGGVEVFSLAANALSTDRRAVRSEGVDILSFSGDGSMLVGSTQGLEEPSSVVITAPFYTENDLPPKEVHSRMWTTQILFPQISSICSHAELLPGHTEGDANWLFAYDHTLMSYRAVRTDDTRTGVAYFLNPTTNPRFSLPAPSTAPTATACGTLVVAGFSGSGLWIYGIPEKLDVSPDMGSVVERHERRLQVRMPLTSATGHIEPLMAYSPSISGSSEDIEDDSLAAKVDWRESLFVKCQQIRGIEGFTASKWVEKCEDRESSFPGKRLVVVAPGGVDQFAEDLGEETMPVDGSRVSILDFDYSPAAGIDREITIEVGEKEPELLMEQIGDMDIEVAMERRRTVRERARGGGKTHLGRSITAASAAQGSRLRSVSQSSPLDVDAQMALGSSPPRSSQQAPLSALQRSATAGGFSTARYPPRPPLGSQQQDPGQAIYPGSPGQSFQAGDGWESPPPPYANPPHLHPGAMPVGLPLIQSHPMAGQGHIPMLLAGIPENAHIPAPHSGQMQPGFPAGPSVNLHHAQFGPQSVQFSPQPQSISVIPEPAPGRQLAVHHSGGPNPVANDPGLAPTTAADMHLRVSPVSQVPPSNTPFAHSASGDSSSRPVSHEGRTSPFTPVSQRQPFPDRPSPLNLAQPEQNPFEATPTTQQPPKPVSAGSITLTGANLQARLNHPVPPTPNSLEQMHVSHYEPAAQSGVLNPVASSSVQPLPPSSVPYNLTPPTADQMANLNRRVSLTARKPVAPISTNGIVYSAQNGSGVPPSPPRGAWGAAGVPGSPSFNKAISSPNGLARNNSQGSGRSIPISSSTPNLHTAASAQSQRPRMGRLDTIDSVSSSYGPGEPGQRSHSVAQGMLPNNVTALPQHHPHPYPTVPQPPSTLNQMPTHQVSVWAGDAPNANVYTSTTSGRRISSDPTMMESSKKKRGKKKGDISRSQTPLPTGSGGKKGSKCVVM